MSDIKYSLSRDRNGQPTKYTNCDRFVFPDLPETTSNPLSRFMLIGSFIARVFQAGQVTNQHCNRCLLGSATIKKYVQFARNMDIFLDIQNVICTQKIIMHTLSLGEVNLWGYQTLITVNFNSNNKII